MVYFLGLLAVALLAASLLVYRNAEETLAAKQKAMKDLIDAQYEERSRYEEKRLDEALLSQAQALARFVQVQFDEDRVKPRSRYLSLQSLGFMSASLSPNAYALLPTWIAQGAPGLPERGEERNPMGDPPSPTPGRRPPRRAPGGLELVFFAFHHKSLWDLTIQGDRMALPSEGQLCDYYQIDSPSSGNPYHSSSMGNRSFPFDPEKFSPDHLVDWTWDDTVLPPDTPVRRVILKAAGVDMVWNARRTGSSGQNPRSPRTTLTIYVQCATDKSNRDAALLAALSEPEQQRESKLAAVAGQTEESLRDLRLWLLTISVAVFAATGIGGFWLVRLGLSPLRRLSDAVSRVSAKDFRLPIGERPLPWELQPIAKRLSSTLDLLKRTFAREKQAVADISHELRTPLAALMTTTEFALRKPRSPEQYRELLGDCLNSAQQMNQIVERLLTLARLDAGVDRLRVQAVDASALAQQCAAVVRPLAEARGLKLLVKCPQDTQAEDDDGACVVQTDGDKLREIVTNLLHNAIQYNRPGGSVALRLARENGTLDVEVEDTGIGMTPETREHIFERFYRADPSRGGDDLHAGLGLAIVKEYIDLMGGSIGVDSTVGQGSTFRVHLPVH